VHALGMSGISKCRISKLCSEIDELAQNFLSRARAGKCPAMYATAQNCLGGIVYY